MPHILQSRESAEDTEWSEVGDAYGADDVLEGAIEGWNALAGYERYRIKPLEEVIPA